jgi:bacterioferritin
MNAVMKALRKMHNMERLATEIYRMQTRAFREEKELADRLHAAMLNEQEHIDNLKARIEDLEGSTSALGMAFQMAGKIMGGITTLLGKNIVLKTDIRIEEKAIQDYGAFLQKVNFDAKSRDVIEKNIQDERVHVRRWEESIEILKQKKPSSKGKE